MTRKITLTLDRTNYFTLRALFKAAERPYSPRPALEVVYYDHTVETFVATDGSILRVQKLERGNGGHADYFRGDVPDFSFVLRPVDFMTTTAQWKARGDHTVQVTGYETGSEEGDPIPYPNYKAVIGTPSDTGHAVFAFEPDAIAQFTASFFEPPRALVFFAGSTPTAGLNVFVRGEFVGIVMPLGEKVITGLDTGKIKAARGEGMGVRGPITKNPLTDLNE